MAAEDDSDIPETGAVFTFGKSKFADNLPNKFWVRNDRVTQVACGDEHTVLVTESGRIFTFGRNDWGQLGLGNSTTADRPCCIKSLKHEKVKQVACGRSHTIVSTESGKLYSFGANGEGQLGVEDSPGSNTPKCIDSLIEQKYKALAAGADHSMALTEEGAVYVWGGGSEGQLGLEGTTECTDPRELQFEERITCISCGYYHSAFVTESGDLYTFGESEQGKLGLGDDPDDTDIPQKVSLPEKVKSVACGGSHTVVLTESGRIYTFGDGSNGQLGHGNHCMQCSTPRLLKLKFQVEKIFCGENHTALVSEKGQVYTFGDGRHGKLGLKLESFSNQYLPQKVGRFKNFIVDKVACGGCHMIVLAFLKPLSNGEVESSDEETSEFNGDGTLGDTIQANGSMDMNSSVTARQKRRKLNESFKNDLNQTLPSLIGVVHKDNPPLHHTVPVPKPRQARQSDSSIIEDVIKAERIERQEAKPAEAHPVEEDVIKSETRNEKSSTVVPKPLPRKQPEPSKKEEESDEEEEESVGSGDEMEDTKHSRLLPQAPVPAAGQMTSSVTKFDSEESEEEKEKEEKEHEAKEEEVKKQKKTKEKKKVKAKIFGSKSKTGLSDDDEEEDEDEEEEEEEDVKEVVSKTETQKDEETTAAMNTETTVAVKQPVIEKEVENKDEDGEKDSKKDKKDKKDKEKQKNKKKKKGEEENEDKSKEEQEGIVDKKSKKGKGKKDKKKDKKKGNKEEEGGEGEEEEDKEGKNKKQDKKKDKKKDKIKKDDEEKEEKEEKDEKEEKKVEEKKDEEEKKDKPVEPPKKKSRTCTIL